MCLFLHPPVAGFLDCWYFPLLYWEFSSPSAIRKLLGHHGSDGNGVVVEWWWCTTTQAVKGTEVTIPELAEQQWQAASLLGKHACTHVHTHTHAHSSVLPGPLVIKFGAFPAFMGRVSLLFFKETSGSTWKWYLCA